jgi:hypothetical protein
MGFAPTKPTLSFRLNCRERQEPGAMAEVMRNGPSAAGVTCGAVYLKSGGRDAPGGELFRLEWRSAH